MIIESKYNKDDIVFAKKESEELKRINKVRILGVWNYIDWEFNYATEKIEDKYSEETTEMKEYKESELFTKHEFDKLIEKWYSKEEEILKEKKSNLYKIIHLK